MKKLIVLLSIVCINISNLFAQNLPSIQLDRPDQTECPFITPAHYIQVENGFNIENITANQKIVTYPTSLWKYGINERCELRLITELSTLTQNNSSETGLLPITIGFKSALIKEKGLIPMVSFIGHITSGKLASSAFRTTHIAPSFRFTMQHTLSEKVSLAYNLGAEWNGESASQNYIYTLTTGISITPKLGAYAELYGFINKNNSADHRTDGGITYLINKDFILDFSGGVGLTPNAPQNYLSLGVSYRFDTRKKSSRNRN